MQIDAQNDVLPSPDSTLSSQELGSRLRAARVSKGWTQEQAAQEVGLKRLALLQIEAGSRSVSSLELHNLARCYGRPIQEFFDNSDRANDPQLVLGRIAKEAPSEWSRQVEPFLAQLKEAVKLSRLTDEHSAPPPPLYQFGDPTSYREAIEQGREMAVLERKRLNLGLAPVEDIASLISCQSVWTAAVPFPNHISGLFLRHYEYGLAVLINNHHTQARRRFSYSHEYAHVLVDRDKAAAPTSQQNASELVEKRANAFASELLMPEAGVWDSLERMRKGGGSRDYSLLYDVASGEVLPHETRNDPLAQRITASEIAVLAHDFKVSYDVAVYRLNDIGAIKRPHMEELLSPEQRSNAHQLVEYLQLYNGDALAQADESGQPHLKRQLVLLAIEAYRREKISDSKFHRICEELLGYDKSQTTQLFHVAKSLS